MAVADPDYKCLYADLDTNGRVSEGGVWNKCGIAKGIEDGSLVPPPPDCLPFWVTKVPYVFVGDDDLTLKNMIKPFPQNGLTEDRRIYNYRHSRARRISKNLFGIIANRWQSVRETFKDYFFNEGSVDWQWNLC